MSVEVDDIVQLSPVTCANPGFSACFLIVTDVKDWGIIGYVISPGGRNSLCHTYFYRAKWEEFEWIGKSKWQINNSV